MRARQVTSRLLAVAAATFVIVSLSGCRYVNPLDPVVGSASPPVATPTSASPALGDGSTSLSCSQRSDGTFSDVENAFGGRVQLDLLNAGARSSVPRARDVGLIVPSDRDWLFRKSPIVVAAGTESVTVSVPDDGKNFSHGSPTASGQAVRPPTSPSGHRRRSRSSRALSGQRASWEVCSPSHRINVSRCTSKRRAVRATTDKCALMVKPAISDPRL